MYASGQNVNIASRILLFQERTLILKYLSLQISAVPSSLVNCLSPRRLKMVSGQLILLPSFVAFLILCFSSLVKKTSLHRWTSTKAKKLPLPPGPKPIPLLGNSLQLPKVKQWETFAKWADQYGPNDTDSKRGKCVGWSWRYRRCHAPFCRRTGHQCPIFAWTYPRALEQPSHYLLWSARPTNGR